MKNKIKQTKPVKPKKPLLPEDDEDDEEPDYSEVRCGDLVVKSNTSLKLCQKNLKNLLRDKQVRTYLNFYKNKKIYSPPSYID